jgi:oligopeptide/dipeptide ABC transporter ATP-binding protein
MTGMMLTVQRPPGTSLLEMAGVSVGYRRGDRWVRVVQDVSITVGVGEAIGLVGESGSGKSQTMLALLRLLPRGGQVLGGKVMFRGRDLLALTPRKMRTVRARQIGLVSQDALSALNPAMTIGAQMSEPLRLFQRMDRRAAWKRCAELLDIVGIASAKSRLECYPHQLSGGMRQRVVIAMAISGEPALLIADEPTTALDATIQIQILRLLDRLRRELGMAMILISHDLGVVAGVTDRVAVMYAGTVVETADATDLFARPRHPYTQALLQATPRLVMRPGERFQSIPGPPPDAFGLVFGCAFHTRCGFSQPRCAQEPPQLLAAANAVGRVLRCHVDPWREPGGRRHVGADPQPS